MKISNETLGSNLFDSITIGTVQGIKLAVNVGGMLLVFVAFIALINALLNLLGSITGTNEFLSANNEIYR